MMKRKTHTLSAATVLACMAVSTVAVAGAPHLALMMNRGEQAGHVKDGERLGKAVMVTHDAHTGFWLNVAADGDPANPAHFVLQGRQDASHRLSVRFVPAGGAAPAKQPGQEGLIFRSGENQLQVVILADGDQTIAADKYPLNLSAALME